MGKLAPSILSADFAELGKQVEEISRAGADYVHIDVMDGHFVPNISFGAAVMKALNKLDTAPYDVHLMIEKPERYVDEFADCGADMLTIHYEACEDLQGTLRRIREKCLHHMK